MGKLIGIILNIILGLLGIGGNDGINVMEVAKAATEVKKSFDAVQAANDNNPNMDEVEAALYLWNLKNRPTRGEDDPPKDYVCPYTFVEHDWFGKVYVDGVAIK